MIENVRINFIHCKLIGLQIVFIVHDRNIFVLSFIFNFIVRKIGFDDSKEQFDEETYKESNYSNC